MTSKKTSFFLYRIPSDRHDTAFVTAAGGRAWTSSLWDSWVMYLCHPSTSQNRRRNRTRFERNALLENLALGRLGIAKVHHLVEELVDDDKVVADGLLL